MHQQHPPRHSVEAPMGDTAHSLLGSDSTALIDSAAGGSAHQCRICLETTTNEQDPFHEAHLIAPCRCKGTAMWVHRGCLDRWRATREDRAFSQCTECFFTYEYVQKVEAAENEGWLFKDGPLTAKRRRRLKFQLFVARDFFVAFLIMQLCVFSLGWAIKAADCGSVKCDPLDTEWVANHYNISEQKALEILSGVSNAAGDPTDSFLFDHREDCCPKGYIINNLLPHFLDKHAQTAYYLVGLVVFLAILGCAGSAFSKCECCRDCCASCGGSNNDADVCPPLAPPASPLASCLWPLSSAENLVAVVVLLAVLRLQFVLLVLESPADWIEQLLLLRLLRWQRRRRRRGGAG